MKKSNIIKFVLACMVLVPSVNSCQEFKMDVQEAQPLALKCDALAEYTANATAPGNIVFNISSNTPWEITSDVQWANVNPKMSASSSLVAEITVALEDNTSKEARTATLTIKGEGLENTQTVKITQASKEDLVVIPYTGIIPNSGAKISFKMTSNKPWEIIPSADFLSDINKKSGEGSLEEETIEVTVPANAGVLRTATLTVKTAFQEETFEITQDGYTIINADDPESKEIELDPAGGTMIVNIASNFEWKPVVDENAASWLSAEKVDEEHLKLTVKYNPVFIGRTSNLVLKPAKLISGFEGATFTVNQPIAFELLGKETDYEINSETGAIKMKAVTGNTIQSLFRFKKGKLTLNFEEVHMSGNGEIFFKMEAIENDSNYKIFLRNSDQNIFNGGGKFMTGGNWAGAFGLKKEPFNLVNGANDVKKVSFLVEDKPNEEGHIQISGFFNDIKIRTMANGIIGFDDPTINPGEKLILQWNGIGSADDYYILKSVEHEPVE